MDTFARVAPLVPVHADRPSIVAVTGAVAVGKSTAARHLAAALEPRRAEVVSTDGFLMTNAELAARHALDRKGFPDSYDVTSLVAFLADIRAGRPAAAPVYSHLTYDRVPDTVQPVDPADVVIIEGLHLLHDHFAPICSAVDLSVFLDADDADLEQWYVERFRELVAAARAAPDAFEFFRSLDPESVDETARVVWRTVNAPNVVSHVRPTRSRADVVLEKGSDHAVRRVAIDR